MSFSTYVLSNSAMNARMPMTSLPLREVVSVDGSSVTLKARHDLNSTCSKFWNNGLTRQTIAKKPRSSDIGIYFYWRVLGAMPSTHCCNGVVSFLVASPQSHKIAIPNLNSSLWIEATLKPGLLTRASRCLPEAFDFRCLPMQHRIIQPTSALRSQARRGRHFDA